MRGRRTEEEEEEELGGRDEGGGGDQAGERRDLLSRSLRSDRSKYRVEEEDLRLLRSLLRW